MGDEGGFVATDDGRENPPLVNGVGDFRAVSIRAEGEGGFFCEPRDFDLEPDDVRCGLRVG